MLSSEQCCGVGEIEELEIWLTDSTALANTDGCLVAMKLDRQLSVEGVIHCLGFPMNPALH
ncbi:unnamed protein product [Ranitomeya imitator]|uniref:Uncharacterized protein n=1 Tax=Ranitomeya imitator TaxID=111125 RepID=A0ABN9MML2_9NEOB|nr:unnamed protein product [Ranitomeya imitator]